MPFYCKNTINFDTLLIGIKVKFLTNPLKTLTILKSFCIKIIFMCWQFFTSVCFYDLRCLGYYGPRDNKIVLELGDSMMSIFRKTR